ncbi:MAG: BTAD domain-containing putative transcriptional regulator [Acidimicrobiia bacterium]|nr:BTAD domain-containing putative transcriptional regulator [Acidimicrobiia bacterium]
MRVQVLGPLTVSVDGRELTLGGRQQRLTLALLVAAAGRTVTTEQLIDGVWGEDLPATARKALQGYVHHLRAEIGDALKTETGGYSFDSNGAVDAAVFEDLVRKAKHAFDVDPEQAARLLRDALGFWNGAAYGDLGDAHALIPEVARLDNLRVTALGDRIDADLAIGRHNDLIGELEGLTYEYPFQERFRAQHMTALYRSGRQVEALRSYERMRRFLVEETGLEPSAELRDLERRILERDDSLAQVARPESAAGLSAVRGYELRELIATTSTDAVYRGYQRSVGREVAVRVLRSDIADDPDFIANFQSDTRRVAALEHPHINFVFDTWREPGRAFQVSRWMGGGSLANAMQSRDPGLSASLRILDQVGEALAYAHRHDVVHGRVDATSILFDESGYAYLGSFTVGSSGGVSRAQDRLDFAIVAHQLVGGRDPRWSDGSPEPDLGPSSAALRPVFEVAFGADGYGRIDDFLRSLRQAAGVDVQPAASDSPPRVATRNPYKGLQAFQEGDTADYFGRETLVDQLVEAVAENRLVALVGPSGSGKSSAVKAGLIPRLRAATGQRLLLTEMFPGAYPFEELEGALLRVGIGRENLIDDLLGDERGLLRVIKQILPSDDAEVVLVIDQFEELFSTVSDEEVRQLFLNSLAAATTDPRSRLRVVVTLRADFFDRPLEYARFGDLMKQGLVPVTMPNSDELARAVAQPALLVGVDFEPGLVSHIVADVSGQPGELPLLQYALTQLFEQRASNLLTLSDYQRSGSVLEALGRRAEELYEQLSPGPRAAARHVFLRMVTVDEGANDLRRRVRRIDLRTAGISDRDLDEILQTFGAHRLVTFDRDPITRGPTIEVAHEALLREWSHLREWIEEQREDLTKRRRLIAALAEWQASGEDDSYLLRGSRLAEFQAWAATNRLPLTSDERAYLEACTQLEADSVARAAARRRRLTIGFASAFVLTAVLAVFALVQLNVARDNARAAEDQAALAAEQSSIAQAQEAIAERERLLSQSRALAGAVTAGQGQDADRALLLALAAAETTLAAGEGLLPETFQVLHQVIAGHRIELRIDGTGGSYVGWNPDGTRLLTAPAPGVVPDATVWDAQQGIPVDTIGAATPVTGAAWSDDGETIVTTHESGDVILWDAESMTERTVLDGGSAPTAPIIDAEGNYLAVRSESVVRLWDMQLTEEPLVIRLGDRVGPIALNPDGSILAIGEDWRGGVVALWNTATGEELATLEPDERPEGVVFDPTGERVATIDETSVIVWDLASGAPIRAWPSPKWTEVIAWSPDGSMIASSGNTWVIEVYDPDTGVVMHELAGHADEPLSLAFHRDTQTGHMLLASTDESGGTLVWRLDDRPEGMAIQSSMPGDYDFVSYLEDEDLILVRGNDDVEFTASSAWPHEVLARNATQSLPFMYHVMTDSASSVSLAPIEEGTLVFNPSTMDPIRTLPDQLFVAGVSLDGSMALVTPYSDGPTFIIDVATGERIVVIEDPAKPIAPLLGGAFSPDGSLVVFGDDGEQVRVFDIAAKRLLVTIPLAPGHVTFAGAITFNRDGTLLAVADYSGAMRVISVPALRSGAPESEWLVTEFDAFDGSLVHAAFTPDGSHLGVSGVSELIRFWSTEDWTNTLTFDTGGITKIFDVRNDGRELVAASEEQAIWFIPFSADALVEMAAQRVTRGFTESECVAFGIDPCPRTVEEVQATYRG